MMAFHARNRSMCGGSWRRREVADKLDDGSAISGDSATEQVL